jgi:hypothetical protein
MTTAQNNNLGRLVKWQDANGGWHTGRVVLDPTGFPCTKETGLGTYNLPLVCRVLIQESCDKKLTWIQSVYIQDWPTRDTWEVYEEKGYGECTEGSLLASKDY